MKLFYILLRILILPLFLLLSLISIPYSLLTFILFGKFKIQFELTWKEESK